MAGHTISLFFKEKGHVVTGFSRNEIGYCDENINGDITDFSYLNRVVEEGNYDAIINAIGILNKDAEDNKDLAVLINSYLPHYLVNATKNMSTKVIQMSTDCVFRKKGWVYRKFF